MDGTTVEIARAFITAVAGVFLLSSGMQGGFIGKSVVWFNRIGLIIAALFLIEGGLYTDLIGGAIAALVFFVQRFIKPKPGAVMEVSGAD